jgi:hypothetical protein
MGEGKDQEELESNRGEDLRYISDLNKIKIIN